MTKPQIYFNEVNERQGAFGRRAFVFGGAIGLGAIALGGRLAQLQIVESTRYAKLSENNQFDFRLLVAREEHMTAKDVEEIVERLAKLVNLDDAHKKRVINDIKNAPRRAP